LRARYPSSRIICCKMGVSPLLQRSDAPTCLDGLDEERLNPAAVVAVTPACTEKVATVFFNLVALAPGDPTIAELPERAASVHAAVAQRADDRKLDAERLVAYLGHADLAPADTAGVHCHEDSSVYTRRPPRSFGPADAGFGYITLSLRTPTTLPAPSKIVRTSSSIRTLAGPGEVGWLRGPVERSAPGRPAPPTGTHA
jgi:hypothetical protein